MAIPKINEDTVTSILAEELRKRGVVAETQVSIKTPKGVRRPDIACQNAGLYVVEAKFRENEYLQAVQKIYNDYLKHHNLLNIKGGFAILYPEILAGHINLKQLRQKTAKETFTCLAMFPPEDARAFHTVKGKLPEIADFIAQQVITPPQTLEISIPHVIQILRDVANTITQKLQKLREKQVENIFGGRKVFEYILQYKEEEYPAEAMRSAAAFLLINQILFYHLLSKTDREKFPPIDEDTMRTPTDLNRYFQKALKINYQILFSYDIASFLPIKALDEIKAAIAAIKAIGPEKAGPDLIGTIFHDLIPLEIRKHVAAYYTNPLVAELLAWLTINRHDAKVADLACGSGGLLVAAYRRKKHLLMEERRRKGYPQDQLFTAEDHRRFVEEDLLGIDVMPFAAHLAVINLAAQAPQWPTNHVNIAVWDSTELKPGQEIPSMTNLEKAFKELTILDYIFEESRKSEPQKARGAVSPMGAGGRPVKLGKYDVIIMNPPFTRQERIPEEYKQQLAQRFQSYKEYLHGQMGFHAYFILLADKFLRDHGKLALVLPATTLRIKSLQKIRQLLAEKYTIKHIITAAHRSAFSESVHFREILLIAEKTKPNEETQKTKIVILKKPPRTIQEARQTAQTIAKTTENTDTENINIQIYPARQLQKDYTNWFKYIALKNPQLLQILNTTLQNKILTPLSQIVKPYRADLGHFQYRGFHAFILFSPERALKKNDVWIRAEEGGEYLIVKHVKAPITAKVPLACLRRGLRRLSYVDRIDVTGNADYIVADWFPQASELANPVTPIPPETLKNEINRWRNNYEKRKAYAVLARRLDLSAPGTRLIAFASQTPIIGIDMWSLKGANLQDAQILALWLNSTLALLQILAERTETRGAWMKIHEYMLQKILVPDPAKLTPQQKTQLHKLYKEIAAKPWPSILNQLKSGNPYRRKLDKAWLQILNPSQDPDKLLNSLYKAAHQEITYLKKIMKEEK